MNQQELEEYMLNQLPDHVGKSEGTVTRSLIMAVAAGIIEHGKTKDKAAVDAMINKLNEGMQVWYDKI